MRPQRGASSTSPLTPSPRPPCDPPGSIVGGCGGRASRRGGEKGDRDRNGDNGRGSFGVVVFGGGAGGARAYLGAGEGDGDPVPLDSVVVAIGVEVSFCWRCY